MSRTSAIRSLIFCTGWLGVAFGIRSRMGQERRREHGWEGRERVMDVGGRRGRE